MQHGDGSLNRPVCFRFTGPVRVLRNSLVAAIPARKSGLAMSNYRIYRIEEDGRIAHAPIVVTCATDEEAIERAQQYRNRLPIELWERERFIKRFGPKEQAPPARS